MFESGYDLIVLHMQKVEIFIPFKIQQCSRISRLQQFQRFHFRIRILSYMRVWDWHLIKHINLSMYLDIGGADCWSPLSWMDLDPLPQPTDENIGGRQMPPGLGESRQSFVDIDDNSNFEHEDLDDSIIWLYCRA